MATDVRTDEILLAAFNAAGPIPSRTNGEVNKGAWIARVRELAGEITLALDPESSLSKAVGQYKQVEKPFVAVILGGKVEEKTGRGIVRFRADRENAEEEEIRTHHLNSTEGKTIWDLVKQCKDHRVLIYKLMEENGGKKFRVLQHLRDLGPIGG
ncbi:hypothetical protein [Cellulosimicrobium sp. Marseille-Q4280]|uniref:hypothetical protein n=1 Tax=Cellulosimicrobium sp. Marseille-Q4280 TaxID=2937992 RepID=UPI00203A4066|nr:hypothetical protein [Cellulosimicrobium sp. Marseille-Q4280]